MLREPYLRVKYLIRDVVKSTLAAWIVLVLALSGTAAAVPNIEPLSEDDLRLLSTPFTDPESLACDLTIGAGSGAGGVDSGRVFFIGDSLTVGFGLNRGLEIARSAGFDVDTTYERLDTGRSGGSGARLRGRSIEAVGGFNIDDIIPKLNEHTQDFDTDNADVIVVSLGTNDYGHNGTHEGRVNQIISFVDYLRSINTNAKIFWVNTRFYYPAQTATDQEINTSIEAAAPGRFTVINYYAEALADPVIDPVGKGDQIHLSGAGYGKKAEYIVRALRGAGSRQVSANGCVCSTGPVSSPSENESKVWAYFTNKQGLPAAAAAGLMGSIAPESGFDPHNMQNTAPLPDGPEMPTEIEDGTGRTVPHRLIRGKYGYGLIQWTSAGRQQNLIDFAKQPPRSTGDLGLQLDFMWKELSENYTGVLAVLQNPDISVREASDEVTLRFVTPGSVTTQHGTPESRAKTLEERGNASQTFFERYSGQEVVFSDSGGCSVNGADIDLEDPDTSNVPCAPGTQDLGPADGYFKGKLVKIRLCLVENGQVNSQLAGSVLQLLRDIRSQTGLNLTLGGVYRSMEQQIATYYKWCDINGILPTPGPYPKARYEDYVRCPGGAPPGWSNHQRGLAIDFVCNGGSLGQAYSEAKDNPCFQWLVQNAGKYGLYEFGKGQQRDSNGYEGWHWSVDGG